jgi:predicted amidophosphoribosyltransferase
MSPFAFVDDVITSGSTAMAAYLALGDPDYFEAWTLVCRPKLAGKSRF